MFAEASINCIGKLLSINYHENFKTLTQHQFYTNFILVTFDSVIAAVFLK